MSTALRQWLESRGLAQYGDRFEADDIDLDILPSLSEQDLEKLGVSMGHRKRLLKAIAELIGTPAAPATAATAPPRAADKADARKVVTIVFADLIDSTSLQEQLDAESVTRLMERFYRALRGAVEAHGGTVVKLMGDGVMAAFGVPRVAEDDAIRAVRAGVAMQEAFRELARRELAAVGAIGLRVGVNTGEVVVAADNTDVVGDPVNVAARLQAEAGDGQVVIGEATRRLVASLVTLTPLGRFALKGRAEAIKAYRVESLDRPLGTAAAAFVGRDDELGRLTAVYDAACAAPAARLAVLLGSPGLGKSRLIEEVGRRLGDAASVVTAHCDAAGGATFAPIAAALREHFQIEAGTGTAVVQETIAAAIPESDAERGRIAAGIAALVADSAGSPEETFFVIRRLLAGLAATKPVLLVIDDLHWAEPLLLDLVEHLVQWGSGTPLLVLVGARPELRDLRSSMVTPGGLVADVVTLGGLDAGAAMRLAASVIGAADLPAAVAAKVLATSEGNPLFVGELVRMLVDEGVIERQGERWVVGANLAAFEMPPTIHALLAARIERLGPDDRIVLERAAVVGRHFSRSAVAALLGRNGAQLDARLEALRRTELIERDTGWFLGEPVLRFHHVLIRDAAYRRLLKGTRAALHEQLADWIEAQVGDAPEHDETIGWHLEQAHQLRRELGPLDASGRALGERAARRLAAAGRRALARDDAPVAAGLLGRALERLAEDDATRAELALDWCEALLASGDVTTAERAIAELGRFVGDAASASDPRLAAWHTCFRGQLTVLTAPQALHDTADAVAAAAADLATLGDAAGEAKGHFVHALALSRLGRVGACEAALDKALAAARRADDRRRANTVLAIAPLAALWGPSPVTRASGRCLDVVRVLRITQGAPAVEAVALSCQAVLEALRGRADAARRMIAAARKMVEDLGITQRLLETDAFGGLIDLLEGDAPAAERALRAAYHGLRDLGLGIDAARAAALLARALLAQDRAQEAEALSHESEALAGDDLKAAIAWRGVRAEALARRGEHATAVELAQAAVGIAAATDALLDHADARLALAAALRAAGRGRDADAEERRAIELWEAKGAVLLVERTRRSEARVAATAAAPEARTAPAPAPPRPAPATRRRITPNRATAALVPFNAAMAAGDLAAFRAQLSESYEEIDHPTGVSYGRDANVAAFERLMRSRDARCRLEPLATLGDALVLSRRMVSASATGGGRFDVGAYEQEAYTVVELDESGRWCRHEVFAADHLADAIVRLYQRYAEVLPRGPEQTRATTSASAFGTLTLPLSAGHAESMAKVLAPDFEGVDHRHLSTWSTRGAQAYLAGLDALQEVAADIVFKQSDILALSPDALLTRVMHSGTDRSSGGAYERPFLSIFVTDGDGRLAHAEWFDADREAKALARFDQLIAGATVPGPVRRRVHGNAATRDLERQWTAIEAHDVEAITALNAQVKVIHHPTGATYGAREIVTLFRDLWRGANLRVKQEFLATLGDSLALFRRSASHDGIDARFGSVGPVEVEYVGVFEVDERHQASRFEIFAADRLFHAVARLYERHAELLPDGPERVRAAATADALAVIHRADADPELRVRALAPDFESVDHRHLSSWSLRGADAYLAHVRALNAVADDVEFRQLDVIALSPSAQLARVLHTGTDRAGGGRYERPFLRLFVADADGRIARAEWFDDDREADALARFDALTARDVPQPAVRRRLTPNAATRSAALFDTAFASPDPTALETVFRGSAVTVVDHPTETTYGAEGAVDSYRRLQRMENPVVRHEPLATLGESLGLFRRRISAAGAGGRFDVGAFERDELVLIEPDVLIEIFADERLGDALVRLYERHAELLPDGPERTWATAAARSLEALRRAENASDDLVAALAPDFEGVDHRHLSSHTLRGAAAYMEHLRAWLQVADDIVFRYRDVLALAPRAILFATLHTGNVRNGGGACERSFLALFVFDESARFARAEWFDDDREAEALARFDEIVARVEPKRAVRRRVTPNAATGTVERFGAAVAARDIDAMARDLCDGVEVVHHQTGTTYGRKALLATWRSMFLAKKMVRRQETIAGLGDSLALAHHTISLEGFAEAHIAAVGPVEIDEVVLFEVDERGRTRRLEIFAKEKLGHAVARLYERHAERLPEGPERARAAATARSVAAWNGPLDLERVAAVTGPHVVLVDHRSLQLWSARGADEYLEHWRGHFALTATSVRTDGVLALEREARLVRNTYHGIAREGGGEFVVPVLELWIYGADGRTARVELWEPDAEVEALARFGELTARTAPQPAVRRRVTPNAGSAAMARIDAALAAGDLDAFAAEVRPDFVEISHPNGVTYGREAMLHSIERFLRLPGATTRHELLATLGDRLWLLRRWMGASAAGRTSFDVGAFEKEEIGVHEVDEQGLALRNETFAADRLGDALVRLYERHAELLPEGAEKTRVAGIARSLAVVNGRLDLERLRAAYTPSHQLVDHRVLGTWSAENAEELLQHFRVQLDLAPDFAGRCDDVLAAGVHALVARMTFFGTARDSGGPFENKLCLLFGFASDGRFARLEAFEAEHVAEALARYDELTGSDRVELGPFENVASRAWREVITAWRGRDLERFAALQPGPLRYRDHRRLFQLDLDREGFLEFTRPLLTMRSARADLELLATRGERLALMRFTLEMEDDAVGPSAIDSLLLIETDERGTIVAYDRWGLDDRDTALAALDARWESSEDAWHEQSSRDILVAVERRDWDGYVAPLAPDVTINDHRLAGFGDVRGSGTMVRAAQAMVALAPDARMRLRHVRACRHGRLAQLAWSGTRDGGTFESPFVLVVEHAPDGRAVRLDTYDLHQIHRALARYAKLRDRPTAVDGRGSDAAAEWFENAAARTDRVLFERFNARDWPGIEALAAPDLVFDERRRMLHNTCGRDVWLEQFRVLYDVPASRFATELLATRGDRLSLSVHRFAGTVAGGGGPVEMDDHLVLHEVDGEGRLVAIVLFDLEDADTAYAELATRWVAHEGTACPLAATWLAAYQRCFAARDWEGMAAILAPDLVSENHRLVGWGTLQGPAGLVSAMHAQMHLAPDTQVRFDHVRARERALLLEYLWRGTRDGGPFEIAFLAVVEFDAAGQARRIDAWDPEKLNEARTRFADLAPAVTAPDRFANAATATFRPLIDALVAHDWARYAQLFADDFRMSDRRRVVQLEMDRARFIAFAREIADGRAIRARYEVVATRGQRLALTNLTFEFEGGDVGPSEVPFLLLAEVNEHGRIVTAVRWDTEDLDAARAELDARYETEEATAHRLSWKLGQAIRAAIARRDGNALAAMCAESMVQYDHRSLSELGTTRGADAWVRNLWALVELSPDMAYRIGHFRTGARGFFTHGAWHGTHQGGPYEIPLNNVVEVDEHGRIVRQDIYDDDGIDEALARFAELSCDTNAPERFANAVTRLANRFVRATDARDWQGLADLFAPDLRFDDRRPLLRMELPKEGFLVQFRVLFDVPNARWTATPLATRGEHLCLFRLILHGDVADDGGPLEIDHLWVGGVGDDGRCDTIVLFEPGDLDAAYAEIDALYVAREGAWYPHVTAVVMPERRPFLERDWDAFVAMHAPDLVCHDHRLLGWGTLQGAAAWVRTQQVLVELAPDALPRVNHVTISERGVLRSILISGTRDGGAFELAFLRVDEIDAAGRICRIDLFDAGEVDAALARFAELKAPARTTAIARFENAASRAWRSAMDALNATSGAALDSLHRRLLRYRDHRHFLQLDLDRAGFLDFITALPPMRAKHGSFDLVATRGERLALTRHSLEMEDDAVGPSAIDSLMLVETDEDGNIAAYDRWDPDDLDAAYAELDARYEAGDAAAHRHGWHVMRAFVRAIARHDFAAVAALCAESMVEYDHRSLAVLGTTRGADAWAQNFSVLADLSADTAYRVDHFRAGPRGFHAHGGWHGTRAGGSYEIPLHAVIELDERGRIVRADIHDDDGIDAALARFAEFAAPGDTPSPSLVKPTSATTAFDRLMRHFDAHGDWDALRAGCSRGFVWEDRRPIVGMSGDVELMIASARERVASGARHERREIIGTAGDRVAISRILWAGGPADVRFEVEFLAVFEIDADGLCSALIFFEPDDLRAAQREAWARWAAIDPTAAEMTTYAGAVVDVWNAQDPERMRALLSEDLVAADHRRTGIGRSEGREAYLRSVVALWELAPDSRLEAGLVWLAHAPHAGLYLCRREGVLPDGGEFVSEFLALAVVERGLTARLEVFETDAADAALARFSELRPDPLRIPPNAVTRTWDRWCAAAAAGDRDTIAALYHPSYRSEDRRPLIRLTTDLAGMLENDRILAEGGWRPTRTLLATAGDRLALQHILWRTGEAGGDSEIEILHLTEVDDEGRFASSATFDPGDRADAFRELAGRHLALTRPSAIPQLEARRDGGRDLARLRAVLPDDFFFHDHRRTGLGRVDGADAYVRSVAALQELAPDALVGQSLYHVADEPHGTLSIAHSFGTLADGGAFESVYVMIMLYGPDGMTGVELFELEDLEAAKTRFAELRATTPPESAR